MTDPARTKKTSPIIYVALGLMAFAVAAPFIGGLVADGSPDNQAMILGPFFEWLLAGMAAGGLGVFCTIVGAWRSPRSAITILAIVFAVILIVAVISLLALLFR